MRINLTVDCMNRNRLEAILRHGQIQTGYVCTVLPGSVIDDSKSSTPRLPLNMVPDEPLNTNDYRIAPGGEGPQAYQWKDKPHRLVYDLCREVERLRAIVLRGPQ